MDAIQGSHYSLRIKAGQWFPESARQPGTYGLKGSVKVRHTDKVAHVQPSVTGAVAKGLLSIYNNVKSSNMVNRALSFRTALLLVAAVAVIPAMGIIVYSGFEQAREREESVQLEASRLVESIVQIQSETIRSIELLLNTVAQLRPLRELETDSMLAIAETLLAQNPAMLHFAITDSRGVVAASPGLPVGTDLSDRLHVQRAFASGGFAAGEYITARTNGEPSLPYGQAIIGGDGAVVGAITAVFPLRSYSSVLERLDLPAGAMVGMTDHRGIRLFHLPRDDMYPVGGEIEPVVWSAFREGDDLGAIQTVGLDGVERFYTYQRLRTSDGDPYIYLAIGMPVSLARGAAWRILWRNLLYLLVVVIIGVLAAQFLGARVYGDRLLRLTATAEQIERGYYDARSGLADEPHELGHLSRAIDAMAEGLEQRIGELEIARERAASSARQKDTLLREIHHRVKNNMQLITSMVHLQLNTTTDIGTFATSLEARVRSMTHVHELLYQSKNLDSIDMSDLMNGLRSIAAQSPMSPQVDIQASSAPVPIETAIPMSLILNELLMNAIKYGREPGHPADVSARFTRFGDAYVLTVTDGGPGIPDSAASSDGLGLQLVHALADQIGGTVTMENGDGATVRVSVPIQAMAEVYASELS